MPTFRADQSSLAAFSSSHAFQALEGARVLIAEDNEVNLEVAKFHLENLGCAATAAVNGAVALDLAKQATFDYVLMDCQMPVMDGFEALRAIRQLEVQLNRHRTPIIAVTAADDLQSQQECADAGFDGFLAKPYSADQLKSALARCGSRDGATAPAVAETATVTAPTAATVIDAAAFCGFVNDFGLDTADILLKPFVALLRETAQRIEAATAKNDIAAIQKLSHKVAGASGTVGAIALSKQARTIEGHCKRGSAISSADVALLEDLVRVAAVEFEAMLKPGAIEAFMNSNTP